MLEVHHIEPYALVKEHKSENLILLCSNCHKIEGSDGITKDKLYYLKNLAATGKNMTKIGFPKNVISFHGSKNTGIVSNNLTIKTFTKSRMTITPPRGSIAENLSQKNYVKYLIDRYHEFKKADVGKANMRYSVLYGAIKREFGAKWDMIRAERFDDLVIFLQRRINNTVLGKNKKSRGQNNYSIFEEYLKK